MSGRASQNVHGTAIVIGTTGLIFVGPSGSGKSAMAHACLAQAQARGLCARLIADDQVFLSIHHGRIIASRPDSIRDQLELRGSGIATWPSNRHARLDFAIRPGVSAMMERLPEPDCRVELAPGISLPLLAIGKDMPEPLSILQRFIPFLGQFPAASCKRRPAG